MKLFATLRNKVIAIPVPRVSGGPVGGGVGGCLGKCSVKPGYSCVLDIGLMAAGRHVLSHGAMSLDF